MDQSNSALDPQAPSQPSLQQAYQTPGNAATQEPAEASAAKRQAQDDSAPVEQRVPAQQSESIDEATPSSLGRGIRGAGPGEEAKGYTHESMGRNRELDGDQMRAPGEGDINEVVQNKPGATGGQEGLESDMDRKKAEQAPAREAIQEERQKGVDVGGVLGQRGGPANPVDKDNYPNKSN